MEAFFYPDHYLRYTPNSAQTSPEWVSTVASLLYFDRLTLGRLGYPDELALPDEHAALDEMKRIQAETGERASAFWRDGSIDGLTCGQIVKLAYTQYLYHDHRYRRDFAPLIEAGVVRSASLAQITAESVEAARRAGEDTTGLDLMGAMAGYVTSDLFGGDPGKTDAAFDEAFFASDGTDLTAAYLEHVLRHGRYGDLDRVLASVDPRVIMEYQREAFLLDMFHQALLGGLLGLPVLSTRTSQLEIRARAMRTMADLEASEPTPAPSLKGRESTEALAARLFAETLVQLPAVTPKSPEDILALRTKLADSLSDFRESVRRVAEDLIDASGGGAVDPSKIGAKVRKEFARPLADLEKRLSHPSRDLARNLIVSDNLMTGVVTFAATLFAGDPMTAAVTLGISVPLLTASVKTLFDRQTKVEQSKVGFLIRAKQN